MRLILSLLLAVSISYAADASTIAHSRSRPAILRSLSTGIYLQATVIFEGHRAKVRFNRGGQIVLDLDNPVTTESEEIMGVDENQNYWAVYVDHAAPEPGRSASFRGASAEDLLDLLQKDRKDLEALQGANTENLEPFAERCAVLGAFDELHRAGFAHRAVEKQCSKQHSIDPNGVPRLLKKKPPGVMCRSGRVEEDNSKFRIRETTMVRKHAVKLVSLFCLALTLAGFVPRATADDDDPPSRVARLAYAQGPVSFQPAGTDDWVTAGLNRPVTTGDKLWSDNAGRVELQLDGSLIRLSNNTGFSFLNLSDNVTQIQLTAGTLLVRVRRLDDNETYEIDTPNLAFSVLRPGLYRISVNEAGDSTAIKIRSGEGEVTGGGAAYTVHANDYDTFSGTDQLSANSENYGNDEDPFDSWAANRDRRWQNSNSAH